MSDISVADAIEGIRDQIVEARTRVIDNRGVSISLSEIEVELQLVTEQKDGVGVKISVASLIFGGEASYDSEATQGQTHTIRFKLDVKDAGTGEDIKLSR